MSIYMHVAKTVDDWVMGGWKTNGFNIFTLKLFSGDW